MLFVSMLFVAHVFQLKMLETVPDSEDAVLKVILDLAAVEGISLPECVPSATSATSSVSLHTTIDTGEQAVDVAWNQLCVLLRKRFLERLKQSSGGSDTSCERRRVVTSLCAVLPRTVVASQYLNIRQLQLDACIRQCLYPHGDQKQNFAASVDGFNAAVDKIVMMISTDLEVLMTGCLMEDLDEAFQMLGSIYFERLQDEVEHLVGKLAK